MVTTENCFESQEFNAYWDQVYQVTFNVNDSVTPDYGWMLDKIVEGFNNDEWADSVAQSLIKGWEDDIDDYDLVSSNSCGTAWHDGCL